MPPEPTVADDLDDHLPSLDAIKTDPTWRAWHPDHQWPWEQAGQTPAEWLADRNHQQHEAAGPPVPSRCTSQEKS